MSQVHHLIDGMNTIRKKESKQTSSNRHEVSSIGELQKVPGFKVMKRVR